MRSIKRRRAKKASTQTYSVPALEKAIDIIELVAGEQDGLLISEIAYRLNRSISELFRIVVVLERREWLQKDPQTSRYSATYRMYELAHRGTPAQAMTLVAAPVLTQLSREISQSCHVVVPAGSHALVVLRQENAAQPGGFSMRLGAVVDLVRSAGGQLILAYMDPATRESVFRQIPSPWGMGKEQLLKQLERIRRLGYVSQPSTLGAGVTDISYPIQARDARVIGALTVPYVRAGSMSSVLSIAETSAAIALAARKISQTLSTIR